MSPIRARAVFLSLLTMSFALSASSPAATVPSAFVYPDTRREAIVETQFGEPIADPYRWLENDVRSDPEVADWVVRQNQVSRAYLDKLPQREWFAARMRELLNFERFGIPVKAGARYFYTRNSGLQNQPQLCVRQGLRGKPRLLLDPNGWAKDSATALDKEARPSTSLDKRSLSVTMPTSVSPSSTGNWLTPCSFIAMTLSATVSELAALTNLRGGKLRSNSPSEFVSHWLSTNPFSFIQRSSMNLVM